MDKAKSIQQKAQLVNQLQQSEEWAFLSEELAKRRQEALEKYCQTDDKKYQILVSGIDSFHAVIKDILDQFQIAKGDK